MCRREAEAPIPPWLKPSADEDTQRKTARSRPKRSTLASDLDAAGSGARASQKLRGG